MSWPVPAPLRQYPLDAAPAAGTIRSGLTSCEGSPVNKLARPRHCDRERPKSQEATAPHVLLRKSEACGVGRRESRRAGF